MKRILPLMAGAALVTACSSTQPPAPATPAAAPMAPTSTMESGIDLGAVDNSTTVQTDFYRHVNGHWLDTFEIPADKAAYVSFSKVADTTQEQLHSIVDGLGKDSSAADPDSAKLADLYASYMDESGLEKLGSRPLKAEFDRISGVHNKALLASEFAHLNEIGVTAPFMFYVGLDSKDSTRYAVTVNQHGLGLPDRDYYLQDDPKLKDILAKYQIHISKMLGMVGDKRAAADAKDIVALETAIAKVQWTKVQNRDPQKTYNKVSLAELKALAPDYDWTRWLSDSGLNGKIDYVIVGQPSYLQGLDALLKTTRMSTWQAYFKWHVLSNFAPDLSKEFVDESFAFYGTTLTGTPQNRPRWKRGLGVLEDSMGEALGKRYVAEYFPPENKARVEKLVNYLIQTYRQDINTLDWMSPESRVGAQAKLDKLMVKIGYPDKWRDYSSLLIQRNDLFGNLVRASTFQYLYDLNKLGKPIDRSEWEMTPQTVNAYYDPTMNEIVFPAAILQPPFFNVKADDAVNYGGIGGVIGHEISHGFDDEGSQYDADGNLKTWLTSADHDKFAAKTKALVEQYNAYEPVKGFHVNGELTLGENIADNSGVAISYKAYMLSLEGKPAPVIDGLSGPQRFFYGWAQVWRGKSREAEVIRRLKSDPHSPPPVRGIAPLRNMDAFYTTFDIKPGDPMYTDPAQRVSIW